MQEKINILEAKQGGAVSPNQWSENQTKWDEIEAKIDLSQTSFENDFLKLSNNLTEMKGEQTSHKSSVIVLDARLTQLESVIDNCTCNSTMLQDHDERIIELEVEINAIDDAMCTNYSKNTTKLQNQVSVHETSITHLEENYQNINDSIQTLGLTIRQLEISGTKDKENINAMNKTIRNNIETLFLSVADLERNNTHFIYDVQGLYTRVSDIESTEAWHNALTRTLNDSITDLQADFSAQILDMNDRNRSIMHLTETVEMNSRSIQNISDKLSAFNAESKLNYDAMKATSEILSQLGLDVNTTMTLLQSLESNVSRIGGKNNFDIQFLYTVYSYS